MSARAPDLLLPSRLRAQLRSALFGQRIYYLPETTSTNDIAKELAEGGEPEGTVVLTDYQSSGRGRAGHVWLSPRHRDLLFSVILRPTASPHTVLATTLAWSLALADVLAARIADSVSVRWPNDVLTARGKLAGILAEGMSRGGASQYVIVGIGVNVNTRGDELARIDLPAVSLRELGGQLVDRAVLLADMLESIECTHARFERNGFQDFVEDYDARSALSGRKVEFNAPGERRMRGTVAGVAADGGLVVQSETERHTIYDVQLTVI